MPYSSHNAKCRSYPGTGQMNAGAVPQGWVEPGTPFQQRPDNAVVHDRETGVVGNDDLARRGTEHRGEQGAGFEQALQVAVVAGVLAGFGQVVAVAGQGQHCLGKVQLIGCWFTTCHVKPEAARAERVVLGAHLTSQRLQVSDQTCRRVGSWSPRRSDARSTAKPAGRLTIF